MNPPVGCPFHPRCHYVLEKCKAQVPPLADWVDDHRAACIRVPEIHPEIGGTAADANDGRAFAPPAHS
jgi:hypothetical protein